ncbi:MAG: GNAT family N-acetyltransferase [Alphaproteobacteria bacterium]
MKTPVLETERLILRPVTLHDAPAIQKYFNNWNIIQHLSTIVPWPYPDDGALTYLRDMVVPAVEKGMNYTWAITIKGDPECVGLIGFEINDNPQNGNRGFWLGEHLHGHGYMSEAVTATNDFIFFELEIERFIVVNAITNLRSRRVKEKTGAVFIGMTHLPHHNGIAESEKWEVTRAGWEMVRKK